MKVANDTSEFISIILAQHNETFFDTPANLEIVYRGQSNSTWAMVPSVFRNDNDFLNERLYLREFQRELPNECTGLMDFDILVKAQHYGVPTRLLDFTLNPLVALYFACSDTMNLNESGKVFSFYPVSLFSQSDFMLEILMSYIFKIKRNVQFNDFDEEKLYNLIQKSDTPHFVTKEQIKKCLVSNQPFFISPRLTNERIRAQQGVFALFNTGLSETKGKSNFKLPSKIQNDYLEPNLEILIPKDAKQKILIELDKLGINKSTLFPELEFHAKDIVNRIRQTNSSLNERIINDVREKICD